MTIEVTAKKVQEAIEQGLAQLGATLDEAEVEVIESGGLFRKAKVRLTVERAEPEKAADAPKPSETEKPQACEKRDERPQKAAERAESPAPEKVAAQDQSKQKVAQQPKQKQNDERAEKRSVKQLDPARAGENSGATARKAESKPRKLSDEDKAAAAHAVEFVKQVVAKMGFDGAEITADERVEMISISAPSGDDSILIGRHGETLSALAYLAEVSARAEKCRLSIAVDCNGYRDRRSASLTAMAKRRADECVAKRRKIRLEPMERIDRRTVHNALNDDERVTTASEGKEPHRFVVILPKQ